MNKEERAHFEALKNLGAPIIDHGPDACLEVGMALVAFAIGQGFRTPADHKLAVTVAGAKIESMIRQAAIIKLMMAAGMDLSGMFD
jgi:hypothetical protein